MFRFPKDYEANTHTFIFIYNHLICTVITIAQYGVTLSSNEATKSPMG
jgi:hypothetical protein